MKFLAWFVGIVLLLVAVVYVVAFTSFGNSLVAPVIEGKIKEQTKMDSKLEVFSLSMSEFEILLKIDNDNKIHAKGNYSLFSQSFNVAYKVTLEKLQNLKPLTNAPVQGTFHTDGTVKGNMAFLEVDGKSDVAKSDTSYHVELTDFNPTSIIASIKEADLVALLNLGGQKAYASAEINLNINFKNITPHVLDGDISLKTKNGKLNASLMKKDFKIDMPQTAFNMNLDAKLKGDDIDYDYSLSSNLANITSAGKIVPEPLGTDIKYNVDIQELAVLQPITNAPFKGPFATSGTVKGNQQSMIVNGLSNVAQSDTRYTINLVEFAPKSVIASIKGAKVSKLLHMLGQPNFASSDLDADIKLTSLDPKNLAGYADLKLINGLLNSPVMNEVYKVNIPKTTFSSTSHVDLKGKNIDYKILFDSNLATLNSSGNIVPDTMGMNLTYGVDIQELAVLKPITGADVRGPFKLNGKVKGDKNKLTVDGKSDVAASDTSFEAILADFKPASVKATMKNLKLAKVLYMVNQPHYADGVFSLDVDIPDARSGMLKGIVLSNIKDGVLDSAYITKEYKFKSAMPTTSFKLATNTSLNGDIVDTKVDLDSSLASFNIKQARMNLKDGSLVSDYVTTIPDLDKLYFASERHLLGGISVNGELKHAKDLDLSLHSKVAGGNVDGKLHNDDFHADLTSLQTLDIFKMLIYPEVLKSSLNGVLDYNIAKEKGTFKAKLTDGKFTQNQMLTLVKQFGGVDLYVQEFKGDVVADINKENIVASLDLNSNSSSIKTKDTRLNSKTKQIDSKIEINANKNPLTITLSGNASAPKVSIDAQKIIEKEATKAIQKQVGNLLQGLFK